MAVSGASRKEIEMRLRNGFEIEDTSEILDGLRVAVRLQVSRVHAA